MMWTPESVFTIPLSSPTLRPKEASSNGGCIAPLPNRPRSPPLFAELQSDTWEASSANDDFPDVISSLYPKIIK